VTPEHGLSARTLRLAHRGDHRDVPENTIAALVAALDLGRCDGLELDVRLSSDGVPVVIHDESLARVQGRPELVAALTADQLAAHRVPTLAAVLALAHRRRSSTSSSRSTAGRRSSRP